MHDLRHTMATRFCENSTNYKYLSRMLGHSSIKIIVDTYVHQTDKSQAEETEKFSGYLDGLFLQKVTVNNKKSIYLAEKGTPAGTSRNRSKD